MGRRGCYELREAIGAIERVGKKAQMLTTIAYRYLGSWGNMGESSSSFAAIPFYSDNGGLPMRYFDNGRMIRQEESAVMGLFGLDLLLSEMMIKADGRNTQAPKPRRVSSHSP
jgi:hypothetical protein